ncbi:GNAT family acetyltransferase [Acidovorax sp. Root275]|uniref:GNAT family N-acetyltransferase n=1 Tax=Acidovorax sp. Root275 TaxID=1736508 RepID=UPI0007098426|nr:GNAT family N-acetyltransferase [Acidovorax sp. Root275]KRD49210.1 GNAT family acetyltransferase [Acidovorax sp. Root275]
MTASGEAPHALCVVPVGCDAAQAACTVVRQSITHCCAPDHGSDPTILAAWLANKTPENVAAWITAPDATAWAAYCGEAMVGFALLTRTTLALCYVVPEALHQGVGRALLREAEARARELGLAALELESTRTAEAFYRRNGYEPAGAVQSWAGLQAQPMRKVF